MWGHSEGVLAQFLAKREEASNPVEPRDRGPHLPLPFWGIAFGIKITSFEEWCRVGNKTGWILRPSRRKKKKEGENNSYLGLVQPTINILAGARLCTASVHAGERPRGRKLNQNIALFLSHWVKMEKKVKLKKGTFSCSSLLQHESHWQASL